MTRSVLVVGHSADADAGYVGERLVGLGYHLDPLPRDTGQLADGVPAAGAPDVLLLLGSPWSVHSPVEPASLASECALARSAAAAGVPVLGLCYGAQVLARAFGGRVSAAAQPEVGWVTVETDDPVLVPVGPWLAFHTDVIDPPATADVVARNACGLQAFVMPGGLGVQFHPEVRPVTLDGWARRFPHLLADAGVARAELIAQARANEPAARTAAYAVVDAFLARFAT